MDTLAINWLAVVVASLSSFVIGAVWFGPKTFYPTWIRAMGREVPSERVEMSGAETALMFGGTYIAALVQVVSLAAVLAFARAAGGTIDAGSGALIGFALAVGFGAFASVSHRMFAQADHKIYRSLKVWLIEVGQDVVCVTIAGAILGAWS
ncbi:MAG: hypothetical protein RLZZ587_819 [Actinomycetota bacterium]|jgi:hypothetical protein